jgi:hypothetical protein
MARGICFAVLVACIWVSSSFSSTALLSETNVAFASEGAAPEPGKVSTAVELRDWLDANDTTAGSEAILTDDITITADDGMIFAGWDSRSYDERWAGAIKINTGAYGITIEDGGELEVGDSLLITGEGVRVPVVSLESGGKLSISSNPKYDLAPCVTVTGHGGIGLQVKAGSIFNSSGSYARWVAQGDESVALLLQTKEGMRKDDGENPMLRGNAFSATGNGALAIRYTGSDALHLFLCTGSGVSAATVVLDASGIIPAPADAVVINRSYTIQQSIEDSLAVLDTTYWRDVSPTYNALNSVLEYVDKGSIPAEYLCSQYEAFPILLSFDVSGLDFVTPGRYEVPFSLPDPYRHVQLTKSKIDVTMIDPTMPFFDAASYRTAHMEDETADDYYVSFIYAIDIVMQASELEQLVLYISNDNKEWRELWKDGMDGFVKEEVTKPSMFGLRLVGYNYKSTDLNVNLEGEMLSLCFPDPSTLASDSYFYFLTADGSKSTTLFISADKGRIISDIGGDRDGGDQDDSRGGGNPFELLPDPEEDPVLPENPGDGQQAGTDDNGDSNGDNGDNTNINGDSNGSGTGIGTGSQVAYQPGNDGSNADASADAGSPGSANDTDDDSDEKADTGQDKTPTATPLSAADTLQMAEESDDAGLTALPYILAIVGLCALGAIAAAIVLVGRRRGLQEADDWMTKP